MEKDRRLPVERRLSVNYQETTVVAWCVVQCWEMMEMMRQEQEAKYVFQLLRYKLEKLASRAVDVSSFDAP